MIFLTLLVDCDGHIIVLQSLRKFSIVECATAELRRFASLLRALNVTDGWHTKIRRKFIQIQVCEYLKFRNV